MVPSFSIPMYKLFLFGKIITCYDSTSSLIIIAGFFTTTGTFMVIAVMNIAGFTITMNQLELPFCFNYISHSVILSS